MSYSSLSLEHQLWHSLAHEFCTQSPPILKCCDLKIRMQWHFLSAIINHNKKIVFWFNVNSQIPDMQASTHKKGKWHIDHLRWHIPLVHPHTIVTSVYVVPTHTHKKLTFCISHTLSHGVVQCVYGQKGIRETFSHKKYSMKHISLHHCTTSDPLKEHQQNPETKLEQRTDSQSQIKSDRLTSLQD